MRRVLSASLPRTTQGTRGIYHKEPEAYISPLIPKVPGSQHREPKVKELKTVSGRSPKEVCCGRYSGS